MKIIKMNINNLIEYLFHYLNKRNNVILSGGSTIKILINKMIKKNKKLSFKNLLLSDERLVSLRSNLRNDLYFKNLIKCNKINVNNFLHYNFSKFHKKKLSFLSNKIVRLKFDLCLLSLGKDCHIASIFDIKDKTIHEYGFYYLDSSPKKPKKRVTISKELIKKCSKIFIVADSSKKYDEIKNIKKIPYYNSLKSKLTVFVF